MKGSQEFWDKNAPRYARSPIRDERSYREKLAITQAYLRPDWRVLEFGCGTGSTAMIHAPHVGQIIATDISGKMLEIAQSKARSAGLANISFQQGTLASLDLQAESFDAVLGLNVLHLLEDLDAAVARVRELLKPGGVFISSTALVGELNLFWRLSIPALQWLGLAPHVNRLDKQALVSLLTNAGFSIERQWQPDKHSLFIVASKCSGSEAAAG